MGALSIQSIIEKSPLSSDVAMEMERLKNEKVGTESANNEYNKDVDSIENV